MNTTEFIDSLSHEQQQDALRAFSPRMGLQVYNNGLEDEGRYWELTGAFISNRNPHAIRLDKHQRHMVFSNHVLSPESLLNYLGKTACLRAYQIKFKEGLGGINITGQLILEGLIRHYHLTAMIQRSGQIEEIVGEAIAEVGQWYIGIMLIK